jgi:hypothetical protein
VYWNTINNDAENYIKGLLSLDDFVSKYPIGARMIIPVNLSDDTCVADVEIIAHNHDNLVSGGKAPLTFMCADLPQILQRMNEESSNSGGWENSEMRGFVNNELLNVEHLDEKSELTHDVDIYLKDVAKYYKINDLREITEEEINNLPEIEEMTYDGINTTIRFINNQVKQENNNKPIRYNLEDIINGIETCTRKIVDELTQER